jgi:hypothetical protein
MLLMRKVLPALLSLTLFAACDGGGGSGPTSPPPVPNANVQGVWAGIASTVSARGTCLADAFQPVSVPVVWTIRQTGASVTAREVLNNAQACDFTGTVHGSSCPGPRAVRIELRTSASIFTGSVDANRMRIDSLAVWRVTETSTGNTLGDYELTGRQDLVR